MTVTRRSFLKSFGLGLVAVGVTATVGESLITAVGKTLLMPAEEIREISHGTFADMLNEYLPHDLLREELMKRDYLLSKIMPDDSFRGSNIQVPFEYKNED
jgi:hypothetical protein